jgi:hypothetical protein
MAGAFCAGASERRLRRAIFVLAHRWVLIAGLVSVQVHAQFVSVEPARTRKSDLVSAQMVPSPYRIDPSALRGIIRYRIRQPMELPIRWPSTSEQRLVPALGVRAANIVVLEVCRTCGDEPAPTRAQLQLALQSNRWADAKDSKIVQLARQSKVPKLSEGRDFFLDDPPRIRRYGDQMIAAIRTRFPDLSDAAYAQTASQAVRSRRADCGEFALVLVAMARARGIPARIAVGMSYSERDYRKTHHFAPHVWSQLWDGKRWISVDAALLEFNAGHIAIAIGDGQPANFATNISARAKLVIEAAGSVPNRTK